MVNVMTRSLKNLSVICYFIFYILLYILYILFCQRQDVWKKNLLNFIKMIISYTLHFCFGTHVHNLIIVN